jgi:hypothetical protein
MMTEVVSQLSMVSGDLFNLLTRICVKDGASQFQNFYANFDKCHLLFSRLAFHTFCMRWVPEMLTSMHKIHIMASALISKAIPQR